ncbi:MAG: hypothetical protein A2X36_15915 [Elusimicrobia bacterium GWA2_69_24]|nr:MAG: hypothetical protein A2X36_15915 [Elusimicrobia bacterium GWA2_69_24]
MDEILEAEKFSAELDKLLAGGKASTDCDAELLRDLQAAHRLASSSLSRESGVRESLKDRLVSKGRERRPPRWDMAAAAACAAALILAPIAAEHIFLREDGRLPPFLRRLGMGGTLDAGFDSKGPLFPDGSTVYESGTGGFSPGGLVGPGTDVITPLNTQDSSALAMPKGVEMRPMEMASFRKLFRDGDRTSTTSPGYRGAASRSLGESLSYLRQKGDVIAQEFNTEGYSPLPENPFRKVTDHPLSTFSIDVDAASYANIRRFLNSSKMPPKDAVRIEEMINYFHYDYPQPEGKRPFSINTELAECPWQPGHKLALVGLQGKAIPKLDLPPSNLVFLVDTSGSMSSANKLELLKKALLLLVGQLRDEDRISIVAYAGAAGLVLPSTPGSDKSAIRAALEKLEAGGSTAGGAGIALAYQVAAEYFMKSGNNRVILATDGDFNVGLSSDGDLVRLIEEKRKQGVFLTVLGFGEGNYQDAKMEKLADQGNGNYAYIDSILEAEKVLVREMGGTLFTIAKDVKLQLEFNPSRVQAYRLIGYENRVLAAEDFNDDKKDAGELGSGHTVTALYELIPVGAKADLGSVDGLKYQKPAAPAPGHDAELLTVKFRYKDPDSERSQLITETLKDGDRPLSAASENFRWAAAAAGFGMLLRGSQHAGDWSYLKSSELAQGARGQDPDGDRAEFLGLVKKAWMLDLPQRMREPAQ